MYRKWQTVSAELSWSHYNLLLSLSDDFARNFYEKQCIAEKWAVEYALGGLTNNLLVSKYQTYLPDISRPVP
ncbi:MAG TPA: DUF1016 N-terminal domain-containing protein [Candidatus Kapabacteria bacterium]|nr:DUF1016 N-terminal domain-containing protein [Candidatus Kapabacteria bacterium]